jgi:hypothetical protein
MGADHDARPVRIASLLYKRDAHKRRDSLGIRAEPPPLRYLSGK